jgi:hypothetical protein
MDGKAAVKKPPLFPSISEVISRYFAVTDTSAVVAITPSPAECMKFVPSQLVPLMIDGRQRAHEVVE